jgi:chromosome segregation ATPase
MLSLACLFPIVLVGVLALLLFRFWSKQKQYRTELQHYSGIVDIDAAILNAKRQLEQLEQQAKVTAEADKKRREQLESEYKQAITHYEQVQREVSLLEENLNDISFGLYKPHFNFQTSEQYKDALVALREEMKRCIRNGRAAKCPTDWTVNGSRTEGGKMVRQTTKVLLRAFNGECEAACAHVTYNNIQKMEERVTKAFEAINKLGETMRLSITPDYLRIRLNEIRLINEYEAKKYQEKQEEQERREKLRDAEKAQREIEQAQQEAEAQEATYQKLLAKARQEAAAATGAKLEELTNKVSEFSAKLDEARQKKEKAIARAQLTKSGFVYVISNIGAFGEGVVKVGMTRRMERWPLAA